MKSFTINKNDADQRLDKFIQKACPNLPQSAMYKYIRKKRIKLNGKRAEISARLSEGDKLELYINDEFFEKKEEPGIKTAISLDIAYEDENILIANKPFGMVVHEDEGEKHNTLINHIKAYLEKSGEYNPKEENSFAPALCNRIDRNTAGLVIAAKTAEALRVMNEKIKNREISKKYLCIVHGCPEKKWAALKSYMFKDSSKNTVYVYDLPKPGAKTAITNYKVLETKDNLSLLEIELVTGRTHQIRAHMAHIGCPLLGDGKYGSNRLNKPYGAKHQALCSYKLTFDFEDTSLAYLKGKTVEIKEAREIIGWQ